MHWRNSNFQIRHFIVGKCHTVDEAYRVLSELEEERDVALKMALAASQRYDAQYKRALHQITHASNVTDQKEARAAVLEMEATKSQTQSCINAAEQELSYIRTLKEQLEPHRKYGHVSIEMANQLCQQEEWKYRLIAEASSHMAVYAPVPAELMRTIQLHPDSAEILRSLPQGGAQVLHVNPCGPLLQTLKTLPDALVAISNEK